MYLSSSVFCDGIIISLLLLLSILYSIGGDGRNKSILDNMLMVIRILYI